MQTRRVSAHEVSFLCLRTLYDKEHHHDEKLKQNITVTFLKIVSQNAPDCLSAHLHFKTFRRGACPQIPPGTLAYSTPPKTQSHVTHIAGYQHAFACLACRK